MFRPLPRFETSCLSANALRTRVVVLCESQMAASIFRLEAASRPTKYSITLRSASYQKHHQRRQPHTIVIDTDQYLSALHDGKGDHSLLDIICVFPLEFRRQAFAPQVDSAHVYSSHIMRSF